MKHKIVFFAMYAVVLILLSGCSQVKHVPQGNYLLDKVTIKIDDNDSIKPAELYNFLRQQPNHKVLGFAKLQLAAYNMSGTDTTKWYNRWFRKLGQPPVIFSPDLTVLSARQLRQAMINKGFMHASVTVDSVSTAQKRRMALTYHINAGTPHTVRDITYDIPDSTLHRLLLSDTTLLTVKPGALFDRNHLDDMRAALAENMRRQGYFAFTKDDIRFYADTAASSPYVDLTLTLRKAAPAGVYQGDTISSRTKYFINRVIFVTDYNPVTDGSGVDNLNFAARDSVNYKDITVLYGRDRYIRPGVLLEKCYLRRGAPVSTADIDRTYESLAQLGILRFINIAMKPVGIVDHRMMMDAYVLLSRNKKQSVIFELEGTNSEGDLGFGGGVTYQHRNLARGSETLTMKLRAAYESLSGNLDGLINNRYTEYAGEIGLTVPKFQFPFLSQSFKKKMRASTEFSLSGNFQERPEYTRVIVGTAWKYKWAQQRRRSSTRHTFDLIDINYVRLPRSTIDFLESIAPSNPLLRYSYEDHFIMRLGYTLYRTNRRIASSTGVSAANSFVSQPLIFTTRASAEIAGNLLYAISSLTGQKRSDGAYKIFGIQYAQYAKAEVDYTLTRNLSTRSSLTMHVGAGVAVPYGNSSMVPFEKRFYAGGANSVRGWSVRTLGPGAYSSHNSVTNFINQCGDISLNLNLEFRAKLFWVFEGAVFADAGNVWTIRNYVNQPDGLFKINTFAKQIAAAYGAGLRLNFTYFLLRFDLGIKAHDPALGHQHWPLIHPRWKRDATFHFSVGYPF